MFSGSSIFFNTLLILALATLEKRSNIFMFKDVLDLDAGVCVCVFSTTCCWGEMAWIGLPVEEGAKAFA